MSTGSHYTVKYPYASRAFHRSLKAELDKSNNIPKLNDSDKTTEKSKQTREQQDSILKNASFGDGQG